MHPETVRDPKGTRRKGKESMDGVVVDKSHSFKTSSRTFYTAVLSRCSAVWDLGGEVD